MPASTAVTTDLRQRLSAAGDPIRADKQRAYMKSALPYYGVSVPEVRRITRAVLREHPIDSASTFQDTVLGLWDNATHREEWYAALEVCSAPKFARFRTLEMLPHYKHLVVTGAWWDVVDNIATHLVGPLLRAHPGPLNVLLREWAHDDHLWLRRTAVLAQVGAKPDIDRQLLVDVLEPNLERPEFFLRKAIGWALRDFARTDPSWVRAYLDDNRDRMSQLSLREAAKHLH